MPDTKQCPYCSEEILTTAKKCKHCGEFIDGELRNARVESEKRENIVREQESSKTKKRKGLWWKIVLGLLLLAFIITKVKGPPSACECYDHLVKAKMYGAAYTNPNYSAVQQCNNYYHLTQAARDCNNSGGNTGTNYSSDAYEEEADLEDETEDLCSRLKTNMYEIEATQSQTQSKTECLFNEMLKHKNDASSVFSACDKLKFILFKISGDNGDGGMTTVNALLYENDYNDLLDAFGDFISLEKALQERKIVFRDYEDKGVKYKVISLATKEW